MKRREALSKVAMFVGGVVSAPTVVAILEGCKSKSDAASGFKFAADQSKLIDEIAEMIIPTSETSGAKEAGVGHFIEVMISDVYHENQRNHFVKGLDDVKQTASKMGGNFWDLKEDQKNSIMQQLVEKAKAETANKDKEAKVVDSESGIEKKKAEEEKAVPFFTLMKELTVFGYFTSEKGGMENRDYVSIPGRYEGCVTITPETKAYTL